VGQLESLSSSYHICDGIDLILQGSLEEVKFISCLLHLPFGTIHCHLSYGIPRTHTHTHTARARMESQLSYLW
jgi:hypothetical protein